MGGLKLSIFLLSSFGIGLKGSIFDILNILFSYFIIALFVRHRFSRVLKFTRVTGKFVSFLCVLKFVGGG